MKYMLLIYGAEPAAAPSPEAFQAELDAYNAFGAEAKTRNLLVASEAEALHPVATATTDIPNLDRDEVERFPRHTRRRDRHRGYDTQTNCPPTRNSRVR